MQTTQHSDLLPFGSGPEEELVTSLNNRTLRISKSGVPELLFRRLGRDNIEVHLKVKIVTDETAGLSLEIGPVNDTRRRYNLSDLEMQLITPGAAERVWAICSNTGQSLNFYPIRIGVTYKIAFPHGVAVALLPPRPTPEGPPSLRESCRAEPLLVVAGK